MALLGTSYGGGFALIGAAVDPRVKVAVCNSGWTDLARALSGGNLSPNVAWAELLLVSARLVGRPDAELTAACAPAKPAGPNTQLSCLGRHRAHYKFHDTAVRTKCIDKTLSKPPCSL